MQTAKNIGSVVGAGMSGYAMGKEHGSMVVGAARGLDAHMNAANMSAIGGRPMPHDTLVQKIRLKQNCGGHAELLQPLCPSKHARAQKRCFLFLSLQSPRGSWGFCGDPRANVFAQAREAKPRKSECCSLCPRAKRHFSPR